MVKKLNITSQLVLGYGAIFLLLLALIVYISFKIKDIQNISTEIHSSKLPLISKLNRISQLNSANIQILHHIILADDDKMMEDMKKEIDANRTTITALVVELTPLIKHDVGRELFQKMQITRQLFLDELDKNIQMHKTSTKPKVIEHELLVLTPKAREYQKFINELINFQTQETENGLLFSKQESERSLLTLWTVSFFLLLISLTIAILTSRGFVTSLNMVAGYIDNISRGIIPPEITESYNGDFNTIKNNLNVLIRTLNEFINEQMEITRKHHVDGNIFEKIDPAKFQGVYAKMVENINELVNKHIAVKLRVIEVVKEYAIGDFKNDMDQLPGQKAAITQAINHVKQSLLSINVEILKLVDSATAGRLSDRIDTSQFQHDYKKMTGGINQIVDAMIAPTLEASKVLAEMANGNLLVRVNGNYRGDHAIIANSLNNTLESFNSLILQIQTGSEQILLSSLQLSTSSQTLSQGSNEQAASTEQISSALTEVEAQAKHNTETADLTNETIQQVNTGAEKSGKEMEQLVLAMNELSASSEKISMVIREIESIAFQTNILALNAAVEAARAGQHGKGFNVVATEVRNLATRSATSAKETAVMVGETLKKIAFGSTLAKNTGDSLFGIVKEIGKVTHLIQEISASSKEQTTAIMQVNSGIHEISQVTMSNAAASEEMAASSEELSSQAESFKETVGRFQVGDSIKAPSKKIAL
jgi:methyl-accepting chemotaxis protein